MKVATFALGLMLAGLGMGGIIGSLIQKSGSAIREYDRAAAEYVLLQCLGDQMLDGIPIDVVAYVDEADLYWRQRLNELASPERLINPIMSAADVVITLVHADSAPCFGYGIEITNS